MLTCEAMNLKFRTVTTEPWPPMCCWRWHCGLRIRPGHLWLHYKLLSSSLLCCDSGGGGGLWTFKYIAWPHGSIHFSFPRVFWRAFSSRQPLGGSRLCASLEFSPSGRLDSTSLLKNHFSQCECDLHTAKSPSFHKSFHVFQSSEKCWAHTFCLLHVIADGPSTCYISLAFS